MASPEHHRVIVDTRFNIGTIATIGVFLAGQTIAGVWWAATMNADVKAMRAWQMRQDDRLSKLEGHTESIMEQQTVTVTLLEFIRGVPPYLGGNAP